MATLLSAVTSDGAGTGSSHNGPCTVFIKGTFGTAKVSVQVSDDNTTYTTANGPGVERAIFYAPGQVTVNCLGTYYVRCYVENASGATSITAVSTQ